MREKKNEIELPFVPAKEKFVLLFSPLGKNLFYVKVRVYWDFGFWVIFSSLFCIPSLIVIFFFCDCLRFWMYFTLRDHVNFWCSWVIVLRWCHLNQIWGQSFICCLNFNTLLLSSLDEILENNFSSFRCLILLRRPRFDDYLCLERGLLRSADTLLYSTH